MKLQKIRIGEKEVFPFTIPSGIIATEPCCAKRLLIKIPYYDIWTSKSSSECERTIPEKDEVENPVKDKEYGLRESIYAQVDDERDVNAVRLANCGMHKTRTKIKELNFPENKVINLSVFGGSIKEVISVVKTLDDIVDCFELNGSCPHSEKGGMLIGLNPKIVYDYISTMVKETRKPVFFKLTPNTDDENIKNITKAVYEANGKGVVDINTVGPYIHYFDGFPVLTSKIGGGISGKGIYKRMIECVKLSREAVPDKNFYIFAEGGIGTAGDVLEAFESGANVAGIGTRIKGMTENELLNYFNVLVSDLEYGTNNAESLLKKLDYSYKKVKIEKIENNDGEFKIFKTNSNIRAKAGQFLFAWLPNIGEKPFSIMDDSPLTIGILNKGYFTNKFNSLKEGDDFYYKGPFGKEINIPRLSEIVLAGGGCGIAGIYLAAKQMSEHSKIISFLGAKNKSLLGYYKEFREFGDVYISTEDGSFGFKGSISDLIDCFSDSLPVNSYFINCGPKAMIDAILPYELDISSNDRILSSLDEYTSCGIGQCGRCVNKQGLRTCVEGPFMQF